METVKKARSICIIVKQKSIRSHNSLRNLILEYREHLRNQKFINVLDEQSDVIDNLYETISKLKDNLGELPNDIDENKLKEILNINIQNSINDNKIYSKLIQNDLTTQKLKIALQEILDEKFREKIFLNYFDLEKKLGGKGASLTTAKSILSNLKKS